MILKNKAFLAFGIFMASCGLKAQDIKVCEDSYISNDLQKCYNCTKEYLKSNPRDTNAIVLIVKCAQSQNELEFIDSFMVLQYSELKEKFAFWLIYGDLKMKMKDSMKANVSYLKANEIDSSFIGINYKLALSSLAWYRKIEKDTGYYSDTESKSSLNKILNYLNRELINNPNDSATLSLKKEVEDILDEFK
jgi:hypothetical protein